MNAGNATPSSVENIAYETRQRQKRDAKERIAAQVAAHIPPSSSVFINIGTTTEAVARALARHDGLRVVTNNLNVATILSANPAIEVIVAGGIVRSRDRGIVGEATIDLIKQFQLDFAVIGISAIDPSGALLDFDYQEVRVAQTIIEHSSKVLLVSDSSKFGRHAMVRLGHLSQIDALFTEVDPPEPFASALERAGVDVHVAAHGK